jgi:hypothetical protein
MQLAARRFVLGIAGQHLRIMDEAVHGALRQTVIAAQTGLPWLDVAPARPPGATPCYAPPVVP